MKDKGFTLLELMITVAIISIIVTTGTVTLRGSFERNALMNAKTQIPTFLRTAFDKSYETGRKYDIVFVKNGSGEYTRIELRVENTTTVVKKLNLSSKLTYKLSGANLIDNKIKTTETGNADFGGRIFICVDNLAKYKVAVFAAASYIKYALVNEFLAKDSINATNYENDDNWTEKD